MRVVQQGLTSGPVLWLSLLVDGVENQEGPSRLWGSTWFPTREPQGANPASHPSTSFCEGTSARDQKVRRVSTLGRVRGWVESSTAGSKWTRIPLALIIHWIGEPVEKVVLWSGIDCMKGSTFVTRHPACLLLHLFQPVEKRERGQEYGLFQSGCLDRSDDSLLCSVS
ncbi:hypothetical protein G6F57_005938 [Rhizopus arrhizus]|uniref:Uncharacterized protein n=1 Tax=Rhizopus oryzae TaxID=64495 RepID=A0A9P6XBT2_RHIOR|nr:hypothetical protein G6F23_008322 [Rhizopus arrhizus]KAG1422147.1 hypothetical protein G6F58_003436 [Rhizopus delemar]KAG0764803.1 hypothetical protein G6F24_004930 [Rhizopus arrhizus]KAG0781101.1 hypothetical protein G6F22_009737 [Rhizopus arrhizus]KAG0786250.1 hypothetical protein G6F21_008722 [Rhizopus arrhizus]